MLDYAWNKWGYHAELSQQRAEEQHSAIPWALSQHSLYPLKLRGVYMMVPSLFVAAYYGLVDVIKSRILDFPGPDPRRRHTYGLCTPFHTAASKHHFEAFEALLSAYGDNVQDIPLWTCSEDNGLSTILHTVLRAARYDQETHAVRAFHFLRQLLAIVDSPTTEVIRLAISGFNINAQNDAGLTPLMAACANLRRPDIIRLLVDHGGDLDATDLAGNTAFLHAIRRCHNDSSRAIEVLGLLLTLCPSLISQRNQRGETALMIAASGAADPAVVQFLLSKSPSQPASLHQFVNARDVRGWTALMHATIGRGYAKSKSPFPHKNFDVLLAYPPLNVRLNDHRGRGIMEIACSASHLIRLHAPVLVDSHDCVFPILYALLDIEEGWDAESIRKAVITGVRTLPLGAVYRLLLEDWVVHSFDWNISHPDTATLLVQAFARSKTSARSRASTCRAPVSIVLSHLGFLKPSLFPGGVQTSHFERLAEVFCGKEDCSCACRAILKGQPPSDPRLAEFLARRRSYTASELEQRIRKG